MLQQEEHHCGDHRMACQNLRVRRPIRADFPWTFLSTNPCFNARVFFLDRDDPFQFNGRGRRI